MCNILVSLSFAIILLDFWTGWLQTWYLGNIKLMKRFGLTAQ